jgi:hypothetical protein
MHPTAETAFLTGEDLLLSCDKPAGIRTEIATTSREKRLCTAI